ncbi:ankyrin repeat domain protein [Apiospora saccharicola]|uniref:Ankyrin repeat domain protein n=1 Tax=Apiospora saccharicola TaxID=335842 RepID=A0ABR1W2L7_9PEZI
MSAVSPATSSATNRTNRGGRPKEWTDPRARRLARLYVFTSLKVEQILELITDEVFTPGKEAASKHLNKLLGKDPRWIRPKDVDEQRERIDGLKKSDRARGSRKHRCHSEDQQQAHHGNAFQEGYYPQVKAESIDGATITASSAPSFDRSDEKSEQHDLYDWNGSDSMQGVTFFNNYNNASRSSLGRLYFKSPTRQGTALTTSTDFSNCSSREAWHSMREKLEADTKYERSDQKDIFRVLKRFTLSADATSEKSQSNSPVNQRQHVQEDHSDRAYTLPGDFLDVVPLLQEETLDITSWTDAYGNTRFHQLAAAEWCETRLIRFVQEASHDPHYRATLAATNTAGQTLLHVLHENWFRNEIELNNLVTALRNVQFDFYAIDVYGRSFFHILRQHKLGSERMRSITHSFDVNTLNRRDAFGIRPMIVRASTATSSQETPARLTIPPTDASQAKLEQEAHFLKIINQILSSNNKHTVEDSQGRNGLHCLAEVKLGLGAAQGQVPPNRSAKRKIDSNGEPENEVYSLSKRGEFLETLLAAGTDVNHYNNSGDTVLMAFIDHTHDDNEHDDLKLIIKRLIDAGAKLEARNRNGETALQVAARLGRKFIVKVLLEHGANIHVRNHERVSIMEDLDRHVQVTDDEPDLYARLEATRAVLTGRFAKTRPRSRSEQSPSREQEWGVRHGL